MGDRSACWRQRRSGSFVGGLTRPDLLDPEARPYFLWWTDLTAAAFRRKLVEGSVDDRAYQVGALLREASTRDVWLSLSSANVASLWSALPHHLGRTRAMHDRFDRRVLSDGVLAAPFPRR